MEEVGGSRAGGSEQGGVAGPDATCRRWSRTSQAFLRARLSPGAGPLCGSTPVIFLPFPPVPRRDHQERAHSHGKLCFRPHSLPAGCRGPGHQRTRDPHGAHQGREYHGEPREGRRRRERAPESHPPQSMPLRGHVPQSSDLDASVVFIIVKRGCFGVLC